MGRTGIVITGLAVLAGLTGVIALAQAGSATALRDEAEAVRLAAVAGTLREDEPVRAMLLSVAAHRLAQVPATTDALAASLAQPQTGSFRDPVTHAVRALSRDGRTLASASHGEVTLWDLRTGRRGGGFTWSNRLGDRAIGMAFSPSGRHLAIAGLWDARVWDVRTGTQTGKTFPLYPDREQFDFSLEYGNAEDVIRSGRGQGASLWNTTTGRKTSLKILGGDLLALSDGRTILYGTPKLRRFTLPRTKATLDCLACASGFALSRDDRLLAHADGANVTFYDARTGEESVDLEPLQTNGGRLTFGPGHLLASVSDRSIQVWDGADLLIEQQITGSPAVAFDGRALRYADGDNIVTLAVDPAPATGEVLLKRVVDVTGERVLALRSDHALGLWDPRTRAFTGAAFAVPDLDEESLTALSADGRTLAVTGDETLLVYDTASGKALPAPAADLGAVDLALSRQGDLLAYLDESEGRVHLFDLRAGKERWAWQPPEGTQKTLAFTPDGHAVAVGGALHYLDTATGRLTGGALQGNVTITAQGLFVAWDGRPGQVRVWRPGEAEPRELRLEGWSGAVDNLLLSADGRLAVVTGAHGRTLYRDGRGQGAAPAGERFDPAGTRLLAVDLDGVLRAHDLAPQTSAVCARAGRTLTPAEWRAYVRDLPYRDVCGAA